MKKIVVLSGAGISAESGIKTFRDSDGLWENYPVEEVATYDSWYAYGRKALMLKFYNERRTDLQTREPNLAHKIVAELEKDFEVTVVTQNIDDLHERAGSSCIIHLHGELTKARGEYADYYTATSIGYNDIKLGDKTPEGDQLRPHIVWFGEAVPELEKATAAVQKADILIIIGTSLVVYPAAGLVHYAKAGADIYLVDPKDVASSARFTHIKERATVGMQKLKDILKP
jgi:NAD-dependent deacetylase